MTTFLTGIAVFTLLLVIASVASRTFRPAYDDSHYLPVKDRALRNGQDPLVKTDPALGNVQVGSRSGKAGNPGVVGVDDVDDVDSTVVVGVDDAKLVNNAANDQTNSIKSPISEKTPAVSSLDIPTASPDMDASSQKSKHHQSELSAAAPTQIHLGTDNALPISPSAQPSSKILAANEKINQPLVSDFYKDSSKSPLQFTGLTEKTAFDPKEKQYFHDINNRFSYVSDDTWRPNDAYVSTSNSFAVSLTDYLRPRRPPLAAFPNRGEYLKQTIVNDFAKGSEKMFLMIKTGATVLWNRLPIHISTTLTRVPYFGLYADFATSVAGYEVVDTLANLTETTKRDSQFKLYRDLNDMRDRHAISDPGHAKLTGGWELDKFKNLPMLFHAWNNAPPDLDWFVFMDADTYLMIDNLMDYLSHLNASDPLYIGEIQYLNGVPFAHGGSGVVLSRAAVEQSLGVHPHWPNEMEEHARSVCCGDYMVAYMLRKISVDILGLTDDKNDDWRNGENFETHWLRNRRRREREEDPDPRDFHYHRVGHKFQKFPHWDLACSREEWCNKIIGFHHLSAMDVEILWEYEQLLSPEQRQHITYCDIYRDFVAPYIEYFMPGWNSMARQKEFTEAKDLEREIEDIERQLREKEREEEAKLEEARKEEEKKKKEAKKEEEKKKEEAKKEEEKKEENKKEPNDQTIQELTEKIKELQDKKTEADAAVEDDKQNSIKKQEEKELLEAIQQIRAIRQKLWGVREEDEVDLEDLKKKIAEQRALQKRDEEPENLIDVGEKPISDEDKKLLDTYQELKKKGEERRRLREKEREEKIEEAKKKLTEDAEKDSRPWHSAELCQRKCLEDPYCNSWRYLPKERYCANDDAVRLGRPAFPYLTYDEGEKDRNMDGAVSGYMIHRIRQTRRDKGCDVNYRSSEESDAIALIQASNIAKALDTKEAYDLPGLDTEPDLYEGWYLRRKLHEKLMIHAQQLEKTKAQDNKEYSGEESVEDKIAKDNIIPLSNLEEDAKILRAQQYLQVRNLNEVKKVQAALLLENMERNKKEMEAEEELKKVDEHDRLIMEEVKKDIKAKGETTDEAGPEVQERDESKSEVKSEASAEEKGESKSEASAEDKSEANNENEAKTQDKPEANQETTSEAQQSDSESKPTAESA